MRSLLDVNVLIALLDSDHVHHGLAMAWLGDNVEAGWVTCPLTENGCLRVMSQVAYPGDFTAAQVAARLREATRSDHHHFWPDDLSLLEAGVVDWRRVIGPRQITDVYLLALAAKHSGRFVTFDAHVVTTMVPDAESHSLCLIDAS